MLSVKPGLVLIFLRRNNCIYIATPPEVNIEVPSDSDSSRRPSTYSGQRRSSFQFELMSNTSSMNDFEGTGKQREEKEDSNSNENADNQKISGKDRPHSPSAFSQGKKSNSGQIATTNSGDDGKFLVDVFVVICIAFFNKFRYKI